MTSLVALVCRAADAEAAIAGGVDRIVIRTSPLPELSAIHAAVSGRCPVSLWWHSDPASRDAAAAASACGADEIWGQAGNELPSGSAWATLAPGGQDDMADIAGRKRQGIVIDGGRERRLLEVATVAVLEEQCRRARKHGLTVGIAGAMESPDIPRLLALVPDRLVVDDVIREGGKSSSPVDPEQLRLVRDLVPAMRPSDVPRQSSIDAAAPDRIFVRDWTVPLHLGAYAHEREAQRVRFTVEAEIAPLGGRAADMRDVVTYDLITDAIARATVTHVALVETIAEDVAAMVLAHPRVEAVDITVEKLDLGPGSLGCRIRRHRA